MPISAAVLALMTIVLVIVVVTLNMSRPETTPPPEPTPQPSPEPIPEAVAVALSRPIPPDERPGDTQVVAVPSPGQVEAEGRKDWPEAAFGVWVECTDLLNRKQFDQAAARMRDVASRSTDRSVRAVTTTCWAAAKVNNGKFAEAGPDLAEARRLVDSLPPGARLDVEFTADLTDLTRIMARAGQASTAKERSRLEVEIRRAADRVERNLGRYTDSSTRTNRSIAAAQSTGVGYSVCRGASDNGACQEPAVVAVTTLRSLPSSLQTGMVKTIKASGPPPGPVNAPNPTTSSEMPTATTTASSATTPAGTTWPESSTTTTSTTTSNGDG